MLKAPPKAVARAFTATEAPELGVVALVARGFSLSQTQRVAWEQGDSSDVWVVD